MARNDGLNGNTSMIRDLRKDLTTTEMRKHGALDKRVSKMWRDFWIGVAHRKGYSNVAIARELEISEATVRNVLNGG